MERVSGIGCVSRGRATRAVLAARRTARVEAEGPDENENGRFGWTTDPEGNRFELWQPPAES